MHIAQIHPGDLGECDINGRTFRAGVRASEGDRLVIFPIRRNNSYRPVRPKHVIRDWRLAGRPKNS
jgi:hypothetical protein